MAASVKLIGIERVVSDFNKFSFSAKNAMSEYLELIGRSAILLLKQNTPKDTGELANSWQVRKRTQTGITIGVAPHLEGILELITTGTAPHEIRPRNPDGAVSFLFRGEQQAFRRVMHPGSIANDFMRRIDHQINGMMKFQMSKSLARQHKFWRPVSNKHGKIPNASKVVGLTGTTFRANRSGGRATFAKRTGRGSGSSKGGTRVRIGRRRSKGASMSTLLKKLKVG